MAKTRWNMDAMTRFFINFVISGRTEADRVRLVLTNLEAARKEALTVAREL